MELPSPTDDSRDLLQETSQAFAAIYRPRYRFMKADVMLVDLVDANRAQFPLLDTLESQAQREHSDRLMATLDALNHRMGRGTVTFGRASPKAAAAALRQSHAALGHALGRAAAAALTYYQPKQGNAAQLQPRPRRQPKPARCLS